MQYLIAYLVIGAAIYPAFVAQYMMKLIYHVYMGDRIRGERPQGWRIILGWVASLFLWPLLLIRNLRDNQ